MTQVNLNSDNQFCHKILNCRKIRDRLVILCEGNRDYLNIHTPQQISKLEEVEDANFWRKTIPQWWRNKQPVFIPCGGRSDVLRIRQRLIELHNEDPENSYLSPEKLYALIDLDIQSANLDHCSILYQTTEDLYHAIYQPNAIDTNPIQESKIIITGWIHKEAYFLEPDLEEYLQQQGFDLYYQNHPLQFDTLYQDMIHQIINDKDIKNNLTTVIERIKTTFTPSCEDQATLQTELKNAFNDSNLPPEKKRNLIETLLKIIKAKPFWKRIEIRNSYEDNLKLAIANFYAQSYDQPEELTLNSYHPHHWINYLYSITTKKKGANLRPNNP